MDPMLMYSGSGYRTVSLTKFNAVRTVTDQWNLLAVQKYGQSTEAEAISNAQV
jgi:hypothetical protein